MSLGYKGLYCQHGRKHLYFFHTNISYKYELWSWAAKSEARTLLLDQCSAPSPLYLKRLHFMVPNDFPTSYREDSLQWGKSNSQKSSLDPKYFHKPFHAHSKPSLTLLRLWIITALHLWLALPPHQHCQFMMTSTHKIKHLPPPHNNLPTYQIFALASGRHLLYSCSAFHLVQLAPSLLSHCELRFLNVYFYIHNSELLSSVGHNESQEHGASNFKSLQFFRLYFGREEVEMLTVPGGNVGDFTVPEMWSTYCGYVKLRRVSSRLFLSWYQMFSLNVDGSNLYTIHPHMLNQ